MITRRTALKAVAGTAVIAALPAIAFPKRQPTYLAGISPVVLHVSPFNTPMTLRTALQVDHQENTFTITNWDKPTEFFKKITFPLGDIRRAVDHPGEFCYTHGILSWKDGIRTYRAFDVTIFRRRIAGGEFYALPIGNNGFTSVKENGLWMSANEVRRVLTL